MLESVLQVSSSNFSIIFIGQQSIFLPDCIRSHLSLRPSLSMSLLYFLASSLHFSVFSFIAFLFAFSAAETVHTAPDNNQNNKTHTGNYVDKDATYDNKSEK